MNLHILLAIVSLGAGFLSCSHIEFVLNQPNIDESVIPGEIIRNFLGKYFKNDQIFVSIIRTPSNHRRQSDFFINLPDNQVTKRFTYTILDKLDDTLRDNRNSFNLILVDDSKQLQAILNKRTVQEFHLNQKFLVVVTGSEQSNVRTLNEAFHVLWTNSLINSHVLIQDTTDSWSLYTFLPYQNDCFALSHLKIESYTSLNFSTPMKLNIDQVYPQKLSDFNGCPLYILPSIFSPYIMVLSSFDGNYQLGGVDIDIVNEISKALNFTIVYNVSFKRVNGTVVNNRSILELLGSVNNLVTEWVAKGEANLTFGAILKTDDRDRISSSSDTYIHFVMRFVYKEEDAYILPMSSLTAPLDAFVWHTIFGILLLSVVMILMMKKLTRKWRHFYIGGRMNRTPILNAWSLVLGSSIANPQIARGRSIGNFARTLTFLWITLWFLVRSSYEGALFNFLHHYQPPSPYETVEKVLASDCKIITNQGTYTNIKHLIKNNRYVENNTAFLQLFRYFYDNEVDSVMAWSDNFVKLFNSINAPHRRLSTTKDRLFTSHDVMYFRKKSVLKNLFNKKLRRLSESGLIEFWISQYIDDRSKVRVKERAQRKLHIENIFGVLQICAVMYLVSFFVFILETISWIHHRIKYGLDWLTY